MNAPAFKKLPRSLPSCFQLLVAVNSSGCQQLGLSGERAGVPVFDDKNRTGLISGCEASRTAQGFSECEAFRNRNAPRLQGVKCSVPHRGEPKAQLFLVFWHLTECSDRGSHWRQRGIAPEGSALALGGGKQQQGAKQRSEKNYVKLRCVCPVS